MPIIELGRHYTEVEVGALIGVVTADAAARDGPDSGSGCADRSTSVRTSPTTAYRGSSYDGLS